MKGLKVLNGDLVFKRGTFEHLENDILVGVERLLTTNLGEFFLDLDMGLDYSVIKTKGYNHDEIKQAIEDCVLQDERVRSVNRINLDVRGRKLYVKFEFSTRDETMEGEVVL